MTRSCRGERRDVVLDDLLDLALNFWCDLARRDLGEERTLGGSEMLTELGFPAGDLVDGDVVELMKRVSWRTVGAGGRCLRDR